MSHFKSFVLLFLIVICSDAQAGPIIRVSTENAINHPQTKALEDFVALANDRFKGELSFELYPTAKLYRGSNVIDAVSAGRMEIAVPGIWHFSRFVPEANIFLLPRFYGLSKEENYQVREGVVGQFITRKIEENLNVIVMGRWIDLGYAHIFTARKKITEPKDLKGLLIRVAGGQGNLARLDAMGAEAVTIPWPDFPDLLANSGVDGTLTTAATVNSVKLWEKGLKYAYLDRQYFPQYIPIISQSIWARLNAEQKEKLRQVWEETVEPARLRAEEYQDNALKNLERNGVELFRPSDQVIAQTRKALMKIEPELIQNLKISQVP